VRQIQVFAQAAEGQLIPVYFSLIAEVVPPRTRAMGRMD
jgi:hypothetical protein